MFPRIAVILGIILTAQPFAARAAGSPADAIQPNSVWQDGRSVTLTILQRNGNRFRARLEAGKTVREFNGAVTDKTISWLAKDVRATSGGPGGDNFGAITDGKIDFTWHDAKGGSGKFSLWRGFEDRTFHGSGGKALPYKLHVPGGYDKAKATGGHPKYSEYPGLGHGPGIDRACNEPDLVPWLLDQKRSARRTRAPHIGQGDGVNI